MTESTLQTADAPAAAPDKNLFARLVGVFFSLRATMGAVVAHPRWLGMMCLVLLMGIGPIAWFVTTGPGRNATIDRNEKAMKVFSFLMTPEQMEQARAQARERIENASSLKLALQTGISALIFAPLVTLVLAAILFFVFKVMGCAGRFKQVFAVVVHAGAITSVKSILLAPLNYRNETFDSATNLKIFVPMLDDSNIVAQLLGSVDLFTLWWVFALAVGLSVYSQRKTKSIAIGLFAVYAVFALLFATIAAFTAARS